MNLVKNRIYLSASLVETMERLMHLEKVSEI